MLGAVAWSVETGASIRAVISAEVFFIGSLSVLEVHAFSLHLAGWANVCSSFFCKRVTKVRPRFFGRGFKFRDQFGMSNRDVGLLANIACQIEQLWLLNLSAFMGNGISVASARLTVQSGVGVWKNQFPASVARVNRLELVVGVVGPIRFVGILCPGRSQNQRQDIKAVDGVIRQRRTDQTGEESKGSGGGGGGR